jgi:hypothetical protein
VWTTPEACKGRASQNPSFLKDSRRAILHSACFVSERGGAESIRPSFNLITNHIIKQSVDRSHDSLCAGCRHCPQPSWCLLQTFEVAHNRLGLVLAANI